MGGIWRRLQLMFGQGVALRVGKHTIQLSILDENDIPAKVKRIQPYGFSYHPFPDCQPFTIFPSGDRSLGICLVQGDTRYTLDLKEGECALHDDQGQKVHLTRTGIVVDGGGLPMKFTNTPIVRFECNIESTGEIIDRVDTAGRSMSGMREIYDSHTHPGDSGGTTGTPNQDM